MADGGIPPIPNGRGRVGRRGRGYLRPFGRGRATRTTQTFNVCIFRGRSRGRGPSTIITSTPYLRLRQRRAGLGRAIGLRLEPTVDTGHSNLSIDAPEFHPAEDVSYLPIMSNLSIDAPEFHPAEDINRLPIMEPDCREICPSQNVDNVDEEQDRSCPPQVAECPPQVAECPPQVAECPPQVAECPPQVAAIRPGLYGRMLPGGAALSADEEAFLQSIMSVVEFPQEQDRSCPPQVAECPPQVAECPPQVAECPPQVAANRPVLYGRMLPGGAALSADEEAFLQSIMSVVESPCSSPRSSAVAVDDLGQLSD